MSTDKTVAEWAAEAFRPCCGTCRAPMLNRKMENLQSCSSCGAHWDGSEASEREATFRARGETAVYWRGSVTDLVTDLAPLLTPSQLVDLAAEAALAWKARR